MSDFHTHIESAIDIWRKTVSYDYSLYSQMLHDVFKGYHVESEGQIKTFWKIYELTVREEPVRFYYSWEEGDNLDVVIRAKKGYKQYRIPSIESDGLTAFNLSNNVKKRVSRTFRALNCCKFLYPEDIFQNNERWSDSFEAMLQKKNSDGEETDSREVRFAEVIQAALFLKQGVSLREYEENMYFHITKSLLNAEYLILDNFSELLNEEDLYRDINSVSVILPWYAYSFVVIAQRLKEMCQRIDKTIREESSRRLAFNMHDEEYTRRRFPVEYLVGKKGSLPFDMYVRSVIEMTEIDHIYVMNTSNMEELLRMYLRSKAIEISILFENSHKINRMVREKVASMICSLADKSDLIHEKYYFTLENLKGEELLDNIRREKFPFDTESNPFLKLKQASRNKKLSESELTNAVYRGSINSSKKDVLAYNLWVNKGWISYCDVSTVIQLMSETADQLKKCDDFECDEVLSSIKRSLDNKRDDELSPAYFIKAITFCEKVMGRVDNQAKRHNELDVFFDSLNDRVMGVMSVLLSRFKAFTALCNAGIWPPFIPSFSGSFYSVQEKEKKNQNQQIEPSWINSYNKKHLENVFFYASLGESIQNPSYYNRMISEKVDFWNAKMIERTYSIRKDVNDAIRKEKDRTDDIVTQLRNENLHTRNHTMQLLGLFAAFIALISSTIGTVRVAHSVPEFIVFLLALTLCIVIFATLISFLGRRSLVYASLSKEKNEDSAKEETFKEKFKKWYQREDHWDWAVPFLLAIMLIIALGTMLLVYKIPAASPEPSTQNTPSIRFEQHNNSTQEYHSTSFQK